MAAQYMDYLIADRTLIPAGFERHYCERIIFLPDSYQVNDSKRDIGVRAFTRAELGLPQSGVVFCCFNNSFKILPGTFDGWMRILKRVEGGVLWLLGDKPEAVRNLRRAAELRHVSPDRLVFARHMPTAEHLARHRVADLFLDTPPYNAHTTASDALWAGLPVLTQIGEAYAGRVAASLLTAIGLPDLITSTQAHYEALAVELAADPERLARLRERLAQNRLTTPLFDTRRYARHLEAAYTNVHERHLAHLPAAHVHVHRAQ
jgi:predicted O-linked N-acetylglucosamine transferase (SPINDLY family)